MNAAGPVVHLEAPRYVLGEEAIDHDALPDLEERAAAFGMPLRPRLWGWGRVHRTSATIVDLAVAAGRETLLAAGIEPSAVGALVLCSTRFPGGADVHGDLVAAIATGLGMPGVTTIGLTLGRCTNLVSALGVARSLVAAGAHDRVLVITTDRVPPGDTRIERFAMFSDGAASCLVGAHRPRGRHFALLGTATVQDARTSSWDDEIRPDLARDVNDRLLAAHGLAVADLDGLLHANLYLPLVALKERQAGFTESQLFTDNVERVGHCFAADPLINLADRDAGGDLADHSHHLLASSVPGARAGALLRVTPVD